MRVGELKELLQRFPDSAMVYIQSERYRGGDLKPACFVQLKGLHDSIAYSQLTLRDYVLERHAETVNIHGQEYEVIR